VSFRRFGASGLNFLAVVLKILGKNCHIENCCCTAAILNMVQGQTAEAVTIRTAVLKEEGMLLERTPGKIDLCGAPHE
jgi:hypothetical protein